MIDVKNKHIVVAGAARSGIAAAILLKRRGAVPFVSDSGPITTGAAEKLRSESVEFEENGHSGRALNGEFLMLSPGIPTSSAIAQAYLDKEKKIYSEVEVASWFCKSPIVAVTGSNGKTSVANWLAHTWKLAGKEYLLAGNIGEAFSGHIEETSPNKDALLEVSSFHLDHIDQFRPYISIILNITPDHLDRYQQDFHRYASSKFAITKNQTGENWFIYNAADAALSNHAKKLAEKDNPPQMLAFSSIAEVANGAFVRNGEIILKINNNEEQLMQIGDIGLTGQHNLQNGMATALAARASEIKNEFIRESLKSFEGVPHRLEMVRNYKGVRYFNDSKATNINAVWYALDNFSMPVVLILGGRDKGNDYTLLSRQIREKVHTVVAIGEARENIRAQLADIIPNLLEAESMKEAVKLSKKAAKRGEVVLLSPACSSFDMFESFEHRGDEFKQAVLEL